MTPYWADRREPRVPRQAKLAVLRTDDTAIRWVTDGYGARDWRDLMALHTVGAKSIDDLFTMPLSGRTLPRYRIPDSESDPETVRELIHTELLLDGNASQNFATFCTTWNAPPVRELMAESIGKNMIDKDEYPQSAEIENRCVHMLAQLWNSPHGNNTMGC